MFDYHHWLNRFPGTNFHELNIDWLVEAVKILAREMHDFEVVNSISYEGVWDIHKQYKKYAIVTDDNKAYISIDLVPAGIQIDNPAYWVLVANFTQEIADLGNRVIALENKTWHQGREGIDNSTRNILFIGDSYSVFLSDPTQNWPGVAARLLNCSHTLNGLGGAGFVGTAAKTFQDLLEEAPTDSYSDIVFGGGYNDRLVPYSDLQTAVRNAITSAHNLYPNANIWVFNMGASIDSEVKYTLLTPCFAYQAAAEIESGRFQDVSDVLAMRSMLAMDGVHPGSNGEAALGTAIANRLKGAYSMNVQPLTGANITRGDGQSLQLVTFAQHNGQCVMDINYGTCTLTTPISINADGQHPISLGTIANTNIMGGNWSPMFGFIYARGDGYGATQHFYHINGQFRMHDQELLFYPLQIADNSNGAGGTAWLSLTDVQLITLEGLHIIFKGDVYIQ